MLGVHAICGHLSEEMKVKFERKNYDLVVISDGMTSQLQPLHVLVNKPFKDYLRKECKARSQSFNQCFSVCHHCPTSRLAGIVNL
jgi:hypothetical protein